MMAKLPAMVKRYLKFLTSRMKSLKISCQWSDIGIYSLKSQTLVSAVISDIWLSGKLSSGSRSAPTEIQKITSIFYFLLKTRLSRGKKPKMDGAYKEPLQIHSGQSVRKAESTIPNAKSLSASRKFFPLNNAKRGSIPPNFNLPLWSFTHATALSIVTAVCIVEDK